MYSYALDSFGIYTLVDGFHVHFGCLWLYLAYFVLGTMFFSFGIKDPFIIMNF
jgi:hypothetical protein